MKRVARLEKVVACLGLTFLSVPVGASTYFIPQVAVGSSGDVQVQTVLTLSNPSTNISNATIVLASYLDDGSPWTINWQAPGRPDLSGPQSWFSFALLPGQTVTMLARSTGPITTGWMSGRSNRPIVLTLRYSSARVSATEAEPLWEVGVLPAAASNEHFIFAAEGAADWSDSTTSTAVAMGNTTSETATVSLALYGEWTGGSPLTTRSVTIPGYGHVASFLPEIFSGFSLPSSFRGMVHVSASSAVAVMTLQGWTAGPRTLFASAGALPFYQAATNLGFDVEPSSTAGQGEIVGLPAEVTGVLESGSDGPDTDYFRLYLQSGQTLAVIGLGEVLGSPLAPLVKVLAENQAVLATGSPILGGFGDTACQFAIPQTGWYSLQVGSPSSSHGRRHFYRVFLGTK